MDWKRVTTQQGTMYISEDGLYKIYSVKSNRTTSGKEYSLFEKDVVVYRGAHLESCKAVAEAKNTKNIILSESIYQDILKVLDKQYQHCLSSEHGGKTQDAYYAGLKQMAENIFSDYHRNSHYIERTAEGKHILH